MPYFVLPCEMSPTLLMANIFAGSSAVAKHAKLARRRFCSRMGGNMDSKKSGNKKKDDARFCCVAAAAAAPPPPPPLVPLVPRTDPDPHDSKCICMRQAAPLGGPCLLIFATLPVAWLVFGLCLCLLVAGSKWALVGRVRPGESFNTHRYDRQASRLHGLKKTIDTASWS